MASHEPQTMQEQIRDLGICFFCLFIVVPIVGFVFVALTWGMTIPDRSKPNFTYPTAQSREVSQGAMQTGPIDGHTLYMAHCASCHGDSGDGKGTRVLDRPARSFLAGGFSFGDTEESITRVVRSGIGGTPMPGFARTLTPAQIKAVVGYVQSMLPERVVSNEADSIMHVQDSPVIVRGKLPEVYVGLGPIPRGLVVGNPDGLSFMYRTDDVRFLGTRQGAFVRRTDWDGRGGTDLELRGRLIHLVPDVPCFEFGGEPVRAQLVATDAARPHGSLHYRVGGADIVETAAATTKGEMAGYRRMLQVDGGSGVQLRIPAWRQDGPERLGSVGAWTWWQEPAFDGRMHFVGIRGAQPLGDGRLQLPAQGSVEIVVFPDTERSVAGQSGVPMGDGVSS
ncbi:MAG: c-type cytochrome [Phycisphaerales bacterium]|nr:c-type cytochrome [Phycisphaerales bacterium]